MSELTSGSRVTAVRGYFQNEKTALRDWYREYKIQETGIPGSEVSFPTQGKIKQSFEDWLEQSRDHLTQLVCVEWNYPEKSEDPVLKESVAFAVALADFFITKKTNFPSPLALASLLVMRGLDQLCVGVF